MFLARAANLLILWFRHIFTLFFNLFRWTFFLTLFGYLLSTWRWRVQQFVVKKMVLLMMFFYYIHCLRLCMFFNTLSLLLRTCNLWKKWFFNFTMVWIKCLIWPEIMLFWRRYPSGIWWELNETIYSLRNPIKFSSCFCQCFLLFIFLIFSRILNCTFLFAMFLMIWKVWYLIIWPLSWLMIVQELTVANKHFTLCLFNYIQFFL